MSDLFDMVAGSSTGAILAAAIVTPKEKGSTEPKFYANDVVDFYQNEGSIAFTHNALPVIVIILTSIAGALLGGFLGY